MTEKKRSKIISVSFSVLAVAACALGVVLGVPMAGNVFKFLTWITAPLVILVTCSKEASAKMREKGPSIAPWLTLTVDMLVAFTCAAFGWFGHGALWAIAGVCNYATFTDYGTKDQPAEKAPDPPRPCVEDLFDDKRRKEQ